MHMIQKNPEVTIEAEYELLRSFELPYFIWAWIVAKCFPKNDAGAFILKITFSINSHSRPPIN